MPFPPRRMPVRMACLILAVGIGITVSGDAKDKSKKNDDPDHGKPRLRLVASPSVGFIPFTAHLTAIMTGVAPDDANFCHPAITWMRVDPGQTEDSAAKYHEDAACRHPPSEAAATTTFTRDIELYQEGAYLFRLVVEGKDHTRVESAYVHVQAIHPG